MSQNLMIYLQKEIESAESWAARRPEDCDCLSQVLRMAVVLRYLLGELDRSV